MPETASAAVSELLARAREGDADALNRLYEASRPWLAIVARARLEEKLRSRVDPSDLVQQTLLEAYRDFEGFAGRTEGEWLAWLRQILLRNAADYVRWFCTAKRGPGHVSPASADDRSAIRCEPTADIPSPSEQAVVHEEVLRLAQAITALSDDYQQVIQLRHFEQLPFDEVAQRMQRSRPAVQMLWLRAVRRLKDLMDERC
jgi:RNA polymerase sigma-70 factor (ECF subfamily)